MFLGKNDPELVDNLLNVFYMLHTKTHPPKFVVGHTLLGIHCWVCTAGHTLLGIHCLAYTIGIHGTLFP